MRSKPALDKGTITRMEDTGWFDHALIFDDLLVVTQTETACFVWKTAEGLVVFDAIWPKQEMYDAIIDGIKDVGWNPSDLKKLVITHGHCDHTGCGKWLVENHGVTTYLSAVDDDFWQKYPTKPDRPDTFKDFDIDVHVADGDYIDCGGMQIYVIATPGHTPGCMSYFFPVHENGEEHLAALLGGATPPWNFPEDREIHKNSVEYFISESKRLHADVALATHTAFDCGRERVAYSKARMTNMPNIYILGEEKFETFCEIYRTTAK